MDLNRGSNIHSVRIKHFCGVLHDYGGFSITEIERLLERTINREKQGYTSYAPELDKALNELARKLS